MDLRKNKILQFKGLSRVNLLKMDARRQSDSNKRLVKYKGYNRFYQEYSS